MKHEKILIGIPVVTGAVHCKAAIDSVKNGADVLVIDNGADEEVKLLLNSYAEDERINVSVNPKNIYVNPAWNQIIAYFITHPEYDRLIIMNSDLSMGYLWDSVCRAQWDKDKDAILVPVINANEQIPPAPYLLDAQIVTEGTPGVFITLTRKQANIVYPIPETLKIWFGDNWIFSILRGCGYKTIIPPNLNTTTQWSQTIKRVPEAAEIIEQDKIEWPKCAQALQEAIEDGKN